MSGLRNSLGLLMVGVSFAALAEPAAAAAPRAPVELQVEDQARPLNVEGAPRFGWLPQDDDGGEIQTAYQVQVRDAAGRSLWDSGKVGSRQQSYVRYAGPPLAPGKAYSWQVRTWDRTDQASPWSPAATFETGLGDADWGGAKWIKRAPGAPGLAGPMRLTEGRAAVRGGAMVLAKTGQGWTDYTLEAKVTPRTAGAALVFRSPGPNSGYVWQLIPGTGLRTQVMSGPGAPTRLRDVPATIAVDTTYALKIEVRGGRIRTWIDGTLVDEQTDARLPAGTIGVRHSPREAGDFDDIKVTGPDGAVLFAEDFSSGFDKWAVPLQEADEYTLARTETALPAGRIVRARSYMAASHTAELLVNGKRADRTSSFDHPAEGWYQAADITSLVQAGGPLALGVLSHWYSGGQGRVAGQPGLLVRVVVDYADGSQTVIVSDGSWKVRRGPYVFAGTRNAEGEYIEHLDGGAQQALGAWTQAGYDASGWSPAIEIGAHPSAPYTHVAGLQTRGAETVVRPVRILKAADGTPVADFGVVMPARPNVHFESGVPGRVVTMRASYQLGADGRVSTSTVATQGTDMRFLYTQGAGAQDYRALTHLGFRYLEIVGAGEDIGLDDVSATVVHTAFPQDRASTFESSDATLNAVWALMDRSLRYSVQETFVDTPTREKGQFLADAANISYGLMSTAGERLHSRQAIGQFLNSQKRYWNAGDDAGRYNAVYPNTDGKRDIPDFTLLFPDWVWRYYQQTGDRELLEAAYPAIAATADYVRRHIPKDGPTEGLVTRLSGGSGPYQYGIVDWPASGRFGYDMEAAARTTVNALSVNVLRTVADAAQALGRPAAEVQSLSSDATRLAARMNATLRRADGTYVDGLGPNGAQSAHAGQHATSYALAFDIAPKADRVKLGEYVSAMGMKQGPMTAHRLLRGLAAAGAEEHMRRLLTNKDDLGWAKVIADGGTFTPEAWVSEGQANSLSHGWGSQAIVDVQESMLGLSVAEPGASAVRVTVPDNGLEEAKGVMNTQRGPVSTDWARRGEAVRLTTAIPVNVTATVELPSTGASDSYDIRAARGAKAELVGRGDGVVRYRVGSGQWEFTRKAGRASGARRS